MRYNRPPVYVRAREREYTLFSSTPEGKGPTRSNACARVRALIAHKSFSTNYYEFPEDRLVNLSRIETKSRDCRRSRIWKR